MRRPRLPKWTLVRWGVAGAFLALFTLAARGEVEHFRGGIVYTETAGVLPLADPLMALESFVAGLDLAASVAIGAAILLLVAALLGPIFCSWVCPLGLLLDLNDALRRRVRQLFFGRRPQPDPVPRLGGLRTLVLGAVLGFAFVSGTPIFLAVSPIRMVVDAVALGATAGLWVLGALVVLEWFLPRIWCRLLCPLGALYAIVGRLAPLRVRIDPATAGHTPCGLCTRHCGMGIRVMEDYTLTGAGAVDDPACVRCGACLDYCPGSVLRLGFRRNP